jgi:membrane protein implicated in regulation of membrane protease activity
MFKTNDLVILGVSAVAAFALLYWLFDWSVAGALVITVAYSVLALLAMYYKSKRSS